MPPRRSIAIYLVLTTRVAIDVIAIGLAYLAAAGPGGVASYTYAEDLQAHWPYFACFLAVWIVAAIDQRLYVSRRSETMVAILFTVAKAFFVTLLFSAFLLALSLNVIDRRFFLTMCLFALSTLLTFRLVMGLSLWNLRRRGFNVRRILVIGVNERTKQLIAVFKANEQYGYFIEGVLDDDESRMEELAHLGVPYLGPIAELEKLLLERVLDSVYIALPVRSHYEKILSVAHLCEGVGVPVRLLADLFPLRMATSYLTRMGDIPLLSLAFEPEEQTVFALRRAQDVATALVLLFMLFPVFIVLCILIKMGSRGPLFVKRPMRGHDGEVMQVLAFRTAKWTPELEAAPSDGSEHSDDHGEFTFIGKYMELYGLDELPQLLDVLRGRLNLGGATHPASGRPKLDNPV